MMLSRYNRLVLLLASMLALPIPSFAEAIDYTYDDVDRLIQVEYGDGTVVDYIYDGVGNRLAKSITLPDSPFNQPPDTPSDPSPSDTAVDVDTNVDLIWTGGDPNGEDAVFYDIYFGKYPDLRLVKRGHGKTSYNPGLLDSFTLYSWKIVSKDHNNATTEGPVWRFTTANHPPSVPIRPSPANGASIISTNVYLSWTDGEDPNPDDTVRYDVYFGRSSPPPIILTDHSVKYLGLGDLDQSRRYYWKVVSEDNHGAETESHVWTFETLDHEQTLLDNVTYSEDTVLPIDNSPYVVKGTLRVAQNTTLTIEPGCVLKFEPGSRLQVDGTLIAMGDANNEIVFTSSKDDSYGGDTNGDGRTTRPSSGDWQYVYFRKGSDNSVIDHVLIQYGTNGVFVESASPTIANSLIQMNKANGIYLASGEALIDGNLIQENGTKGIIVYSGEPTIRGNVLRGNGDYDLYFVVAGGIVTGNTFYCGLYMGEEGSVLFVSNTIYSNPSYPLTLGADVVGALFSSNTIADLDDRGHVEVIGGTITQDAYWPKTFVYRVLGSLMKRDVVSQ